MNTSSGRSILFHCGASSLLEQRTLLGMTPPLQDMDKLTPAADDIPVKLLDQRRGISH